MSSNNLPEFILLSEVINKLRDKEYYRTFAKTLIMTNLPDMPIPAEENLVNEMFRYFIESNKLNIYFENTIAEPHTLRSEAESRVGFEEAIANLNELAKNELDSIWENEVYIEVQGLKKLYANNCIVFPNSLLKN